MFRKLIKNLTYSPSLIEHLSIQIRKVRHERTIRKIGVVFIFLALTINSYLLASQSSTDGIAAHNLGHLVAGGFVNNTNTFELAAEVDLQKSTNPLFDQALELLQITTQDIEAGVFETIPSDLPDYYITDRLSIGRGGETCSETLAGAVCSRSMAATYNNVMDAIPVLRSKRSRAAGVDDVWFAIDLRTGNIFTRPPQKSRLTLHQAPAPDQPLLIEKGQDLRIKYTITSEAGPTEIQQISLSAPAGLSYSTHQPQDVFAAPSSPNDTSSEIQLERQPHADGVIGPNSSYTIIVTYATNGLESEDISCLDALVSNARDATLATNELCLNVVDKSSNTSCSDIIFEISPDQNDIESYKITTSEGISAIAFATTQNQRLAWQPTNEATELFVKVPLTAIAQPILKQDDTEEIITDCSKIFVDNNTTNEILQDIAIPTNSSLVQQIAIVEDERLAYTRSAVLPGSKLQLQLSTTNASPVEIEHQPSVNIIDFLPYVDIDDLEDATLIDDRYVTWNLQMLEPSQTIYNTFTIAIKDDLPTNPVTSLSPLAYDGMLETRYGNGVRIVASQPFPKMIESTLNKLPRITSMQNVAASIFILIIVTIFYVRDNVILKELSIVKKLYTGGQNE